MLYIIVDEQNNVTITQNQEEVDRVLKSKEGAFYMITKYGNYVTAELYQNFNKKIYRIDSKLM